MHGDFGTGDNHWPGDVDDDGGVTTSGTTSDRGIITTIFNSGDNRIGEAEYRAEADLDRDGDVDGSDRTLVGSTKAALPEGRITDASATGPDSQIGWDGYVFNAETMAYKVRFRGYEPALGRWWQRDLAGYVDGMSLYLYVSSNPITLVDPLGAAPRHAARLARTVYEGSKVLWNMPSKLDRDDCKAENLVEGQCAWRYCQILWTAVMIRRRSVFGRHPGEASIAAQVDRRGPPELVASVPRISFSAAGLGAKTSPRADTPSPQKGRCRRLQGLWPDRSRVSPPLPRLTGHLLPLALPGVDGAQPSRTW